MESEELKLLRENNQMLKAILTILSNNSYSKDFIVNLVANLISESVIHK